MAGWRRILKTTGKFVGKAVGKEVGVIPDETELSDKSLAQLYEVITESVAEGVYQAMRKLREEDMAKFNDTLEALQKEQSFNIPTSFADKGSN